MNENKIEPKDTFVSQIGNGITIRQYFAGLAIQGLVVGSLSGYTPQTIAKLAVEYADALIVELNKPVKP